MKKIISFVILMLLFNCGKERINPEKKQLRVVNSIDKELVNNVDKLILISHIEEIKYEDVKAIVEAYYIEIYRPVEEYNQPEQYQKLINKISTDYKLTTQKTASILFTYIYESRTNKEIGEEYIEELLEDDVNYDSPEPNGGT